MTERAGGQLHRLSPCAVAVLCDHGTVWRQPGADAGYLRGVYIAGGIVPRFLDFFTASGFRGAFEDKGRFRSYVQDIPVYLIVHDNPGLLGSGAHLRQVLGQIL